MSESDALLLSEFWTQTPVNSSDLSHVENSFLLGRLGLRQVQIKWALRTVQSSPGALPAVCSSQFVPVSERPLLNFQEICTLALKLGLGHGKSIYTTGSGRLCRSMVAIFPCSPLTPGLGELAIYWHTSQDQQGGGRDIFLSR